MARVICIFTLEGGLASAGHSLVVAAGEEGGVCQPGYVARGSVQEAFNMIAK
jgi:hypothetical protein